MEMYLAYLDLEKKFIQLRIFLDIDERILVLHCTKFSEEAQHCELRLVSQGIPCHSIDNGTRTSTGHRAVRWADNGWLLTATHSISCLQDLAIETCLHYAITPFRSRKSHCPRCPERQLIMVSPAPSGVLVWRLLWRLQTWSQEAQS